MTVKCNGDIAFVRLPDIPPDELLAHMSDPRLLAHMPLLTSAWDRQDVAALVATKEECWRRDGLGHWAILWNGEYVGWGGFQNEAGEWDFGLVLKPEYFGLGVRVARMAIAFAIADERIPFVTFLLPPSRKHLGWLSRLGARFVGEVSHGGAPFLKYRLDTA